MQQGLTFERKKKAITKCSTLKVDLSANFHLTHDFLLAEALSTPQKLEKAKRNGPFSIYLEYLDAKKMMDKVDISV